MAPLGPGTICSVPPTPATRRCRERACALTSRPMRGWSAWLPTQRTRRAGGLRRPHKALRDRRDFQKGIHPPGDTTAAGPDAGAGACRASWPCAIGSWRRCATPSPPSGRTPRPRAAPHGGPAPRGDARRRDARPARARSWPTSARSARLLTEYERALAKMADDQRAALELIGEHERERDDARADSAEAQTILGATQFHVRTLEADQARAVPRRSPPSSRPERGRLREAWRTARAPRQRWKPIATDRRAGRPAPRAPRSSAARHAQTDAPIGGEPPNASTRCSPSARTPSRRWRAGGELDGAARRRRSRPRRRGGAPVRQRRAAAAAEEARGEVRAARRGRAGDRRRTRGSPTSASAWRVEQTSAAAAVGGRARCSSASAPRAIDACAGGGGDRAGSQARQAARVPRRRRGRRPTGAARGGPVRRRSAAARATASCARARWPPPTRSPSGAAGEVDAARRRRRTPRRCTRRRWLSGRRRPRPTRRSAGALRTSWRRATRRCRPRTHSWLTSIATPRTPSACAASWNRS